ncbi:MAG: family 10 glycosylhydrolase [Verrucomicrobiota bacterium]
MSRRPPITYNVWGHQTIPPPQPTHPYNLHPEWLTQDHTGAKWAGDSVTAGNYQLDQGHPEVQKHLFDVTMDILTRYDVDGIHLDYIRYSDHRSSLNNQPWGYNPVSLARFKRLRNIASTPAPGDPTWLQWRRDQVTALVRKIYLNALRVKPGVRISAALITYGTAPSDLTLAAWQAKEAYGRTLQDWRAWMEEGILDLACPMIYRTSNSNFSGWSDFMKERQYNRAGAAGMGWYLNTVDNTIAQIGIARAKSPGGRTLSGVIGYSYAVPNNESLSQDATWAALVAGPFQSTVSPPAMPWKTDFSRGHLLGYVSDLKTNGSLDGAIIQLTGPISRQLTTDATGFFGAVDLPVGTYTATLNQPGYEPVTQVVTVTGATVAQQSVSIKMIPLEFTSVQRDTAPARLDVRWNSVPNRTYRVEGTNNLRDWVVIVSGLPATGASTRYQWTLPPLWNKQSYIRVIEE